MRCGHQVTKSENENVFMAALVPELFKYGQFSTERPLSPALIPRPAQVLHRLDTATCSVF